MSDAVWQPGRVGSAFAGEFFPTDFLFAGEVWHNMGDNACPVAMNTRGEP